MLKELLKLNSHIGYTLKESSSKNYPYLYGSRNLRCIINLENTVISLKRCFLLLKNIIKKRREILIVLNNSKTRAFSAYFRHIKNRKNIKLLSEVLEVGFFTKKKNKFDLILLLNIENNEILLEEIKTLKTPVLSIIDTNNKFNNIHYPIMINENSLKTLFLLNYFFKKIYKKNH